jgi:hypothetical protein
MRRWEKEEGVGIRREAAEGEEEEGGDKN